MYAITLTKAQDWQGAYTEFKPALRLNPSHADSYYRIGKIDLQKGRDAEATDAFKHAVALQVNHLGAWYQLSRLFAKQGMTAKAKEALDHQSTLRRQYNFGVVAPRMQ